jgi:hypothetical protein
MQLGLTEHAIVKKIDYDWLIYENTSSAEV